MFCKPGEPIPLRIVESIADPLGKLLITDLPDSLIFERDDTERRAFVSLGFVEGEDGRSST